MLTTDQETAHFVHEALFRQKTTDETEPTYEYLADALYDAASRAKIGRMPRPLGAPSARWMFSTDVKKWLSDNQNKLGQDLAMFVSTVWRPITDNAPAPKGR